MLPEAILDWGNPLDKRIIFMLAISMLDGTLPYLPMDSLRTFIAAAECGSFTSAARKVHLSQAAVSMQVKRLEELVGQRLFMRQGRGVALTDQGELLLHHSRRLVQLHDETLAALQTPELAGVVRFGAPEDYASLYLPPILKGFAASHPRVRVELRCDTSSVLRELTAKGELDLALSTEASPPASAEAGELVHREAILWAASNDFSLPQDTDEELPLALFHPGCLYRLWALQALEKAGQAYRVVCSSLSIAPVLAAVHAGLAVAPVAQSIPRPGLRALSAEAGLPSLPRACVVLHSSPAAADAPVRSFAQHVRQAFHQNAMCGAWE